MKAATPVRVLLCADPVTGADDVRQFLAQAGYEVGYHGLNGTDPDDPASVSLIVLEGSRTPDEARQLCQRLH